MFSKSAPIEASIRGKNLIALTGERLVLAALISFAIFAGKCIVDNTDEAYATRLYSKLEIKNLTDSLAIDEAGRLSLKRMDCIAHYWSHPDAYAFRIWDGRGATIFGGSRDLIESASPVPRDHLNTPDSWQRKLGPVWFETLSGQRVTVGGRSVWIEIATRSDPLHLRMGSYYKDFMMDVVVPVVPTFMIAITLALFSLRRALQPVHATVLAARGLDPTATDQRLQIPTERLPDEVAELANAVNELLLRTNNLVQSQSEFIGRAAHQLRTPLAIMLLETEKFADPRAERLQRDITQLGETVDRLLELARMQSAPRLTRGRLDLKDLAEDVELDLEILARKRGARVKVVDLGTTPVSGDYVSMREALRNLVINAIVHHPGEAKVEIRCGPGARISVEDDGPGISPEHVPSLFEPFSRQSTSAEGAGLGLAVVHKIVELHNGAITVRTSDLGGAAFCIELTACADATAEFQFEAADDTMPQAHKVAAEKS